MNCKQILNKLAKLKQYIIRLIPAKLKFLKFDITFLISIFVFALIGELKLYFFYVLFLILHEMSHYFVSKKLGYKAKQIKLSMFGAALEGNDDFLLDDELKVIFAGPLFNLMMACLCYLVFWFEPELYETFYEILQINLIIFAFNILPIFPLDGGRILLVFLSKKYERQKALKIVKFWSICFIFALFFFCNFMLDFSKSFACLNLMILCLEKCEETSFKRQIFIDEKLKLLKNGLPEKTIYLPMGISKYSLFKHIDSSHYFKFVFVDDDFLVEKQLSEIEFYNSLYEDIKK